MRVLTIVLDYLSFLPPAFLCFLPMKDQLRYSLQRIAATVGVALFSTMLLPRTAKDPVSEFLPSFLLRNPTAE